VSGFAREALRATGLLPLAQRAKRTFSRERRIVAADLRSWIRPEVAPDGLPIPPARLRHFAVGSTDIPAFLDGGRLIAGMVEETLAANGIAIEQAGPILDFGVGCGRVMRCFAKLGNVELHGSDYNPALVRWCSENLPFATFTTNGLAPPLAYPDGRFELVYSYSVFTHFTAELGLAWMAELRRVLAPGGHLLVTTHGDAFANARLVGEELERYRRGEIVIRQSRVAGTNACAAFHPIEYVRGTLAEGFEVLDWRPGVGPSSAQRGAIRQDVFLLRKLEASRN
jgi:SAM-dependent methyltransferase